MKEGIFYLLLYTYQSNMNFFGFRCIGAVEVRKAMRALGFKMTRDQARQMVHDASVKGKG